jgi:2-C-methyl-D-erythritol 4-phosphate cytidylyltransferase
VKVPIFDLSGVVPLPISIADNRAAAFGALAGESALIRVVRVLLGAVAEPRRVVVAAAEPLLGDVGECLASQDLSSFGVTAAVGPANRAQCLAAALEYLEDEALSTPYVLVHDISAPLASTDLQDRVVTGLRDGGTVVMPALAVTDSVKAVDERGSVTGGLDRSMLRAVQYPRGFAADQLAQLLARCTSEQFDELAETVGAGVPITMVEGDPDGFRAELPRDAQFVEAVIASRQSDPQRS